MPKQDIELLTAKETMQLLGMAENAFSRFRKLNPDFPQPLPGLGKRLFLKSAVVAFVEKKCGVQSE